MLLAFSIAQHTWEQMLHLSPKLCICQTVQSRVGANLKDMLPGAHLASCRCPHKVIAVASLQLLQITHLPQPLLVFKTMGGHLVWLPLHFCVPDLMICQASGWSCSSCLLSFTLYLCLSRWASWQLVWLCLFTQLTPRLTGLVRQAESLQPLACPPTQTWTKQAGRMLVRLWLTYPMNHECCSECCLCHLGSCCPPDPLPTRYTTGARKEGVGGDPEITFSYKQVLV